MHVSQLRREGRVNNVADVVQRGQRVRVKILNIVGTKISLSLKDVDQNTGEDLNPASKRATGANTLPVGRNPERPVQSRGTNTAYSLSSLV